MSDRPESLILCFDGTWNNFKSDTNVSRIYSEIADRSSGCTGQLKFYDEGVGTHWYDKFRGGAFGLGLDRNIRLGYAWLASVFEAAAPEPVQAPAGNFGARTAIPFVAPADARKANGDLVATPGHSSGQPFLAGPNIYLFGFSRGAFTARSLGGMINYLGIPKLDSKATDSTKAALCDDPVIRKAWALYKDRPSADDRDAVSKKTASPSLAAAVAKHDQDVSKFREEGWFPVRIHFVGVWDTVGALGIPRIFDFAWLPRLSDDYRFHDTALCQSTRNAFHAVAIDEQRLPYKATMWTKAPATVEAVEQRWFPGAHADVGGGYEHDLLPASPLEWLACKAAACGLKFVNDRFAPNANPPPPPAVPRAPARFDLDGTEYLSPVHDSYAEFMYGAYRAIRSLPWGGGRVFRRMLVATDGVNQTVDDTAFKKWRADPDYRPPNLGQAGRVDVSYHQALDDGRLGLATAPIGDGNPST